MEFERYFNPGEYDRTIFDDRLHPNSGGRYCLDTTIIFTAIGLKGSTHFLNTPNNVYNNRKLEEKFERWFSSFHVTVPQPVLAEIYYHVPDYFKPKVKKLLNRPTVRLLINEELASRKWEKTLSKYVPEVVKILKDYRLMRNNVAIPISDEDAEVIAISDCEKQYMFTVDPGMLQIAFRHGILHFDIVKERKLPDKPVPSL